MRIKRKVVYNKLVFLLLYYCAFQEVMIPLIYCFTSSVLITNLFFYFKDILLIALFLKAVGTQRTKGKIRYVSLLYLMYIALIAGITLFRVFWGNQLSISSLLGATRNFILLPMLFCIGASIADSEDFRTKLEEKWFYFIFLMAIIGIVEYFLDLSIGTKNFWINTLGYTRYYTDIKLQTSRTMVMGLPGNFYGYGKGGYFSQKRLVGIWANPLTSAYSMLPATIYYFIKSTTLLNTSKWTGKNVKDLLRFVVLFVAVYLTHTRAIFLLFIAIVAVYVFRNIKRNVRLLFFIIVMGVGGLFFLDFADIIRYLYDGSTAGHILSFTTSIRSIKDPLFGSGIGSFGIYGIGTESSYITLFGSMGIIGLIFYLTIFINGLTSANRVKGMIISQVVLYSGLAYLITGIISEQLFAFTSIAQFYILLGYLYRLKYTTEIKFVSD